MYFPQDMDIIKFLLDNGADIDAFDKSGNTPLCGAVAAGRPGAVELLLNRGAEINAPNKKGFTPVMLAVISNKPGIFRLLVDKGADLNKRHPDGWNVFELERSKLDPDIRKYLDRLSPKKEQSIPAGFPGLSGMHVKEKE
jgi:ankyrin repeat protein